MRLTLCKSAQLTMIDGFAFNVESVMVLGVFFALSRFSNITEKNKTHTLEQPAYHCAKHFYTGIKLDHNLLVLQC